MTEYEICAYSYHNLFGTMLDKALAYGIQTNRDDIGKAVFSRQIKYGIAYYLDTNEKPATPKGEKILAELLDAKKEGMGIDGEYPYIYETIEDEKEETWDRWAGEEFCDMLGKEVERLTGQYEYFDLNDAWVKKLFHRLANKVDEMYLEEGAEIIILVEKIELDKEAQEEILKHSE